MQTMSNHKKYAFLAPIPYHSGITFWQRDMGLSTLGALQAGYDCLAVCLPGTVDHSAVRPVLHVSFRELTSKSWWLEQGFATVVFLGWGSPKFAPHPAANRFSDH